MKAQQDEPSFGRAKVGEMYDELPSQIDPNYAGNPIPRVETSAIKYDFRSEMMRRDSNGKLDGNGIKAGDAITTTASIAAPLVVGGAISSTRSATSPQSLNELNGLPKGLSDFKVRGLYNERLDSLNTNVKFTEENARFLVEQRNAVKAQARDLMVNRRQAALLDKTRPIHKFEYYVDKYTKQGYTGEALWEKIIKGSAKPNANVNKMFGIEK